MSGHDWKVLMAFGLLLGGLSLYDSSYAVKLGGVAIAVVLVRNSGKIPGAKRAAAPARSAGSTTMQV